MSRDGISIVGSLIVLFALVVISAFSTATVERHNNELRAQIEAAELEIKELREAMAFVEQQGN